MKRWEYKILDSPDAPASASRSPVPFYRWDPGPDGLRSRQALEAYLTRLGDDGWEVVNITLDAEDWESFTGIAKRELA